MQTKLRTTACGCEDNLHEKPPCKVSIRSESLRMTILDATFQAEQDCMLPQFKGSTLRGALGHSLIAVSGHQTGTDGRCFLCERTRCAYGYVFTERSVGNGRNGVLPLIIQPPLDDRQEFREGDAIQMKLTLIGDSLSWTPSVVWALGRMGWKGLGYGRAPWTLTEVKAQTPNGTAVSLLENFEAVPVVSGQDIVTAWPAFDRCEVQFQTPVCIRSHGQMLQQFDAVTLIKRLNGRFGDLLETFCGNAPCIEEMQSMNSSAEQIQVESSSFEGAAWERFSTRSGQRHNVDGITGTMKLSGIPEAIARLLVLGQFLHVGKSAAFGMGNYRIVPS